ncbi:putative amidase protein [Neofusicoccum parvum UCRNP2]|uniref:Putative amidase protein n=1 Tax=Botryosphaeria parva (strain UCR-NP2) TaxID=1287680 RepID=R1FZ73_BOTPV|nr:putative amidase protein [Neofusicoccum parvum UCRNP2]
MSVVFLSSGPPTVDVQRLRAVAAKHNVTVPQEEEEHYRHLLNGLDATADHIKDLPEYEDPRLKIDPETLPRICPADSRLAGRTVAFKDNVSVGGVPITGGTFPELLSGKSEYPISKIDAVVVSRVLQSGGTVAGTATCEHFSMSPLSFTSASGPVQNPWLPGFTTGGSSSGCAALVAINSVKAWRKRHNLPPIDAELGDGVDMAVGGDQGGSIRIPACYSGIYGLKPTHGLVPYTGVVPLFPMIDHAGPMAASLDDLAALLAVLAGYDGMDPRCTPETPLRQHAPNHLAALDAWRAAKRAAGEWTPTAAGRGLRVGVITESFTVAGLSPAVVAAVRAAVQQFGAVGASVEEVSIPEHLVGPSVWTVATRAGIGAYGLRGAPAPFLAPPVAGVAPPPLDQAAFELLNRHNPAVANMWFNATLMAERDDCHRLVGKAMMHALQLRAAYDRALDGGAFDVLVAPVNPRVGSRHPALEGSVEDKMRPAIGATLNTCQFNVTGHPALSMPAGFADVEEGGGKMPVGMQLVARRFDEASILKAAAAWEEGGLGLDKWDGRLPN